MQADRRVVAADVRDRIFRAVEPILSATLDRLDKRARALVDSGRVLVIVQPFPCILRVVFLGLPNPVELERVPGDFAPGLEDAVRDAIAGVLASHDDGGELALGAAAVQGAAGRGGFLVLADPEDGAVEVSVVPDGKDLALSVLIGAIAERQTMPN